jgi:YafQ family addiction module toxin component
LSYIILLGKRYRKQLRTLARSGVLKDVEKLNQIVDLLKEDKELHISFRDHPLRGNMTGLREFHLAGDIVVTYEVDRELRAVTLVAIGSHSQIF